MDNFIFATPASAAVFAAIFLVLLVCLIIRKNLPFLIIFSLLLLCRVISGYDFFLLGTAQTWLAIVLGSLKDFLFVSPFLYLNRYKPARFLAVLTSAGVLFLNIFDVIYIKETYSRLQQVVFENVDTAGLLARKDFLGLGLGSILISLLIFYYLFFKLKQPVMGSEISPVNVNPVSPAAPLNALTGRAKRGNVENNGHHISNISQTWLGKFFKSAVSKTLLLMLICASVFCLGLAPQIPKTGDYLTDEINMERDFALVVIADSAVRNLLEEALWPPPTANKPTYAFNEAEQAFLKDSGVLDRKQANPRTKPAYKRIIYVFVESLSYDFLQCKVVDKGACTMPFYFSLLQDKNNLFLSNYYSSSFTTDEGIYSAFASRPDFAGDCDTGREAETIFSLAKQKGYRSAYFMGASVYFRSKFKTYINTMKVDEIYGKEQTMDLDPQTTNFPWGDTDARIFEKALLWLTENKKEKTITIICTINTHPPFYSQDGPPPGIEDTPITRAFYSTDVALQNFVQGLKKAGILDKDTLLIIGADHQITHGGELALDHLPESKFGNRHIPLVMIAKNSKPLKGINPDLRASAIDMAPTMADLLALPEQPTYYGKSLFLPKKRYDLAMTRGGLFFFDTDEENFRLDLRTYPKQLKEEALYKWYFNMQQRAKIP